MQIRTIYDPLLRSTVAPVTVFDDTLKSEAEEMFRLMEEHIGMGLAANQVGLNKQLFVYGYHRTDQDDELPEIPFTALCNPKIIKTSSDHDVLNEGCLSLPGLELPVRRSRGVTVQAQTLEGKPVTIKAKNLTARIIQHEIDHLNGILFTDRTNNYSRIEDYRFAKIVFLGSDDFSYEILNRLLINQLNVISVITETTKRAGRGDKVKEPVVKKLATEAGIAVFQPETKEEITEIITQLQPDLLILASYGKILPAETLFVPIYGCLNIHPSILPQYRGATPVQTALLNGDVVTGVTIMTMVPAVDAGALIAQEKVTIEPTETAVSLKEKLAVIGGHLLIKVLPAYLAGQAEFTAQDPQQVTATRKLTKEMGEIDWSQPAIVIDRQIRALTPWPGTFTDLGGQRLKILAARLDDNELVLETVQLEGKKPTVWADFERGYHQQLTKTSWYAKIRHNVSD